MLYIQIPNYFISPGNTLLQYSKNRLFQRTILRIQLSMDSLVQRVALFLATPSLTYSAQLSMHIFFY